MRPLFYLFIFFFITVLISCGIKLPGPGDIVDVGIDMILRDTQGENLLEVNNNNKIIQDSIKIYYVENGVETEVFNPSMDLPRNFYIYEDQIYGKIFGVFLTNDLSISGMRRVIVKWNSKDQDIIDGHFVNKDIANGRNEAAYCDSVWVNGALKFPNIEFHPYRKFIFIK